MLLGIFLVDTNAMVFGMPSALFPALALHRFGGGAGRRRLPLRGARTPARSSPRSLSGWIAHVRRQGLGVRDRGRALGRGDRRLRLRDDALARARCCSRSPGARGLRQRGAPQRRSSDASTPDPLRGRLSGIEFAQVASAPALGERRGRRRRVAHEPALLDRLGRHRSASSARVVIAACRPGASPLRRDALPGVTSSPAACTRSRPTLIGVDAARRRRRRADRRGRGLRPRGSGEPRLPRPHRAQRLDVRPARARVRLPLVRDPLVPEPRLRGRGRRRAPCSSARSSRRTGSSEMRERRGLDDPRLLCCRPGPALPGARRHARARRPAARPAAVRAARRDAAPVEVVDRPADRDHEAAELPWRYGLGRLALPQPPVHDRA